MTGEFDPNNSRHVYLRSGMERGNGIACIRTSGEAKDAMKAAGFTLEVAEDLAASHKDALPWWYFCNGETQYAQDMADWFRVGKLPQCSNTHLKLLSFD